MTDIHNNEKEKLEKLWEDHIKRIEKQLGKKYRVTKIHPIVILKDGTKSQITEGIYE